MRRTLAKPHGLRKPQCSSHTPKCSSSQPACGNARARENERVCGAIFACGSALGEADPTHSKAIESERERALANADRAYARRPTPSQQQVFSPTAGVTTMDLARRFSTTVLASLAVLPHAIGWAFWGSSQLVFAAAIVGAMAWLALNARPLAKWAVLPMATMLSMKPCPDWLCRRSDGPQALGFDPDALLQSAGFSLALFIAYALIFLAMCLLPVAHRGDDA